LSRAQERSGNLSNEGKGKVIFSSGKQTAKIKLREPHREGVAKKRLWNILPAGGKKKRDQKKGKEETYGKKKGGVPRLSAKISRFFRKKKGQRREARLSRKKTKEGEGIAENRKKKGLGGQR